MNNYIGIDLGTSGAKILLVSASGKILAENTQRYPVDYPGPGMSEQNPADWLRAAKEGVKAVLDGRDASCVKGISFGGQMHGSVLLDKCGNVIRPAILWNDGRTGEETDYLNNVVGKDTLRRLTGNIAFAGFTAPKLLWLKKHEPGNFAKATKIMLPKDYLAYKFSGEFCTDLSDASGTLLLDVERRDWSDKMCKICGIDREMLPKLYESSAVVGEILPAIADELGLPRGVKIIAGAGDNAAAAVGTGIVGEGGCNISLGTSGTLFVSSREFRADKKDSLHAFCHADGGWHVYLVGGGKRELVDEGHIAFNGLRKRRERLRVVDGQKRGVFFTISDGRAQPPQRCPRTRRFCRYESGHFAQSDDPCCFGRRGVCAQRLS